MPALFFIHHGVDLVNCALKTAPFAPLTLGSSVVPTEEHHSMDVKRLSDTACHVRAGSKIGCPPCSSKSEGVKKKRTLSEKIEELIIKISTRKGESGVLLFRPFNDCLIQHSLKSAGFFPFPPLPNCSIISHITSNCWASMSSIALSIVANKNRGLESSAFHTST